MLSNEHINLIKTYRKKRPKYIKFPKIFKEEHTIIHLPFTEINIQPDENVKKELNENGYEIIDYLKGTAKKITDEKNVYKIGKVLNKLHNTELIKKFEQRTKGTLTKDQHSKLLIVFTYNDQDIAGMSTNKHWTSCYNLDNGCNKETALNSIKYGNMAAYLIKEEDYNDLDKSLARISIKRFVHYKDNKKYILLAENKIFGDEELSKIINFQNIVDNILNEYNLTVKVRGKKKFKRLDSKEFGYSDSYSENYEYLTIKEELKLIINGSYKVLKNGSINVDGDVNLKLEYEHNNPLIKDGKLTVKFNKVSRNFTISYCGLTSLDGCPNEVGGTFNCDWNNLKTLEGCPSKVNGDFCAYNNIKKFTKTEVNKFCKIKGCILN